LLRHFGLLFTVLGCGISSGLGARSLRTRCRRNGTRLNIVRWHVVNWEMWNRQYGLSQLRGSQSQWLDITELRHRQCHVTLTEYAALMSWLPPCLLAQPRRVDKPPPGLTAGVTNTITSRGSIPPCITGIVTGTLGQDQVVLQSLPPKGVAPVAVSAISDQNGRQSCVNTGQYLPFRSIATRQI
jgi:hypothetical protein